MVPRYANIWKYVRAWIRGLYSWLFDEKTRGRKQCTLLVLVKTKCTCTVPNTVTLVSWSKIGLNNKELVADGIGINGIAVYIHYSSVLLNRVLILYFCWKAEIAVYLHYTLHYSSFVSFFFLAVWPHFLPFWFLNFYV
jgi:hypothetical protein